MEPSQAGAGRRLALSRAQPRSRDVAREFRLEDGSSARLRLFATASGVEPDDFTVELTARGLTVTGALGEVNEAGVLFWVQPQPHVALAFGAPNALLTESQALLHAMFFNNPQDTAVLVAEFILALLCIPKTRAAVLRVAQPWRLAPLVGALVLNILSEIPAVAGNALTWSALVYVLTSPPAAEVQSQGITVSSPLRDAKHRALDAAFDVDFFTEAEKAARRKAAAEARDQLLAAKAKRDKAMNEARETAAAQRRTLKDQADAQRVASNAARAEEQERLKFKANDVANGVRLKAARDKANQKYVDALAKVNTLQHKYNQADVGSKEEDKIAAQLRLADVVVDATRLNRDEAANLWAEWERGIQSKELLRGIKSLLLGH